jgi:NTP pyrophosphatase (non-canonical NTP hydrolase)
MKFSEIDNLVGEWAEDKWLRTADAEPAQVGKLLEEVGELVAAIMKYNLLLSGGYDSVHIGILHEESQKIKDSIGDTMVLLSNIAAINSLTLKECYLHAYMQIKDRTGKTVNGEFIKDAP